MLTIRIRRRTLLAIVALIALLLAGIAISAWSTSTSGNAYSKATTATPLVLSDASASTSGDLYPGGSGDLKLKVANPNSFPVRITAVSLTWGGTITSNSVPCNSGGTGVTLTLDLAANAAAAVYTVAGAVHMSSASDTTCQGAIFTIPVDVTAASN